MNEKKNHERKNKRGLTIRLDDLCPKDNVIGGKRKVIFGIIRNPLSKKERLTRDDA